MTTISHVPETGGMQRCGHRTRRAREQTLVDIQERSQTGPRIKCIDEQNGEVLSPHATTDLRLPLAILAGLRVLVTLGPLWQLHGKFLSDGGGQSEAGLTVGCRS